MLLFSLLLAQAAPAVAAPRAAVEQAAAPSPAAGPTKATPVAASRDGGAPAAPAPDPIDPADAPGAAAPGADPSDPDPDRDPDPDPATETAPAGIDDEEPRSIDASLESAAGRMGERHVELLVRARSGEVTLVAGAETLASDRAPERRAAIVGAELALAGLSWEGELRTAPPAEGLSRLAALLAVHSDAAGLSVLGRDETLRGTRLRAAGLALDLDQQVDADLRLGLSASAWATDLRTAARAGGARGSRDPWSAFGAATLDWAERWELSLSAKRALGPLSIAPGLAVAQPAQDGAFSGRASLGLEARLGPARLALSAALAHLWPADLWLADAMLGVSWHVGDE